jgi:hypothetical protein
MIKNNNSLALILISILNLSCVFNPQVDTVNEWSDLMGKKALCKAPGGPARVFFFSPHLIGIWSTDSKYILEYFRTLLRDEDKKIYLESVLKGDSDLKSYWLSPGSKDNRRIIIEIKDGIMNLVVGHGIGEDNEMLNSVEMDCVPDGPITNFFNPDHFRQKK